MQNMHEGIEAVNDKREHLRLPLGAKVNLQTLSEGPNGESAKIVGCQTVDVSRGGLRVKIGQELVPNSILQIGVQLPSDAKEYFLTGEVMWCVSEGSTDEWMAGFRLINGAETDYSWWYEALEKRD
ncbi:hypothetical protein A3709_20065 [Halioglobus sp. HI00S01]|uniref:PilZ domain-containing protein n=1 Tax=Halioglobus sp. HI00S01 TaxID=1822214 RepID=UPI0007C20AE1|nr:PilZ domain-containing protein [Halioglobus sp. HI00S01]KZX57922.1 hypothetical protein A3709_20065 [Halioglobus sp. HI00S01]